MYKTQSFNIDSLIRISIVVALVYWSFLIVVPLIGVLTWGIILAVALFPAYKWLYTHLGNHRTFAAILLTCICLFVFVGSLTLLANNMFSTIHELTIKLLAKEQIIPQPPEALKAWPLIGQGMHQAWSLASINLSSVISQYADALIKTGKFLVGKTAHFSLDLILFIISLLFSGYLLSQSDRLIHSLKQFSVRIAPERGLSTIQIMNNTIKSVSRGVIGLSLFQTLLLGLLLLLADAPGAGILSFIALLMCIAQLGLFLLVIPIIFWLFFTKSIAVAFLFSVLFTIVALLDNFLKPFILARGLQTPIFVIFIGVIGGVISHGVIGIFIGPVILAVLYDFLIYWLSVKE